jgi:hypothetical protein
MDRSTPELDPVHLLAALSEEVVGESGLEIAAAHFGQGETVARLAEWYGMSPSTLHDRLTRLWARLEAHNAVPPAWTRPKPGRRRIVSFPTGAELYSGPGTRRR